MSWPSGLLSVHWLLVCWANGKREGKEKKDKWGGEETGWEGEEREVLFILVRLSLCIEWKDGFVFQWYAIDSKLSSNMRCWGGWEASEEYLGYPHLKALLLSFITYLHHLEYPLCKIDASVLTDRVCLKGTKRMCGRADLFDMPYFLSSQLFNGFPWPGEEF